MNRPLVGEDFRLTIPGAAEYVVVARLFMSAIARHIGVDEESVADLKVALSDVCAEAIAGGAEPITVAARIDRERLVVTVPDTAGSFRRAADGAPAGIFEGGVGLEVLRGLFPDATVEERDGVVAVRFSCRAAGR